MRTQMGWASVAALGMMGLSAGVADAQVLSFGGSGYEPGVGGNPSTVAPNGTFSVPPNDTGEYRVEITYGMFENGEFKKYADGSALAALNGQTDAQSVVVVSRVPYNWAMTRKNVPSPPGLGPDDYIRAQLEYKPAGSAEWQKSGTPQYHKAAP